MLKKPIPPSQEIIFQHYCVDFFQDYDNPGQVGPVFGR